MLILGSPVKHCPLFVDRPHKQMSDEIKKIRLSGLSYSPADENQLHPVGERFVRRNHILVQLNDTALGTYKI